ncbi:hypothetical protein DFR58_14614 [Anaerobacterium chartisolvens]|uniref:Uncharacterized protein n=1 Tax=Anaerobacterium chartisolvens TaxID=1297424 RepID=A0A369AFI8_9FIRM|nr:hypothetical protein [Anaerobacterium chartisolvens]RCX08089.1 hypothetical protein DFR58_14614 [Anaerobacterium chartisolvens]
MLDIKNICTLKDFIENDEYVIRDIVDCNAYSALYFNLIGAYRSYNCYTESSDVIDYVLLMD